MMTVFAVFSRWSLEINKLWWSWRSMMDADISWLQCAKTPYTGVVRLKCSIDKQWKLFFDWRPFHSWFSHTRPPCRWVCCSLYILFSHFELSVFWWSWSMCIVIVSDIAKTEIPLFLGQHLPAFIWTSVDVINDKYLGFSDLSLSSHFYPQCCWLNIHCADLLNSCLDDYPFYVVRVGVKCGCLTVIHVLCYEMIVFLLCKLIFA